MLYFEAYYIIAKFPCCTFKKAVYVMTCNNIEPITKLKLLISILTIGIVPVVWQWRVLQGISSSMFATFISNHSKQLLYIQHSVNITEPAVLWLLLLLFWYILFPFCVTEPEFVSSYEIGDVVMFFFREVAVEFINCGKVGADLSL